MKPRIVILDDYEQALRGLADWRPVDALAEVEVHHAKLRGEALMNALEGAQAVVLVRDRTPLKADLLAKLPQLRYVVFTGARNTQLDRAALGARGIPVSHTEGGPSKDSTVELTWALILAASKRLESHLGLVRQGRWRDGGALPGILAGERLGLVGFGEIGSRVGRVGRAFGMEVVTWSPHMTPERAARGEAIAVSLEELLSTSKVVSLHLVPSETTRGLINAARLATMRTEAIFVNTSRSVLVDMGALAAAVAAGRPRVAALDVYDEEPLAADEPLAHLPNFVLTPHIGFVSQPVYEAFAKGVIECLLAWLRGEPLVRTLA